MFRKIFQTTGTAAFYAEIFVGILIIAGIILICLLALAVLP